MERREDRKGVFILRWVWWGGCVVRWVCGEVESAEVKVGVGWGSSVRRRWACGEVGGVTALYSEMKWTEFVCTE